MDQELKDKANQRAQVDLDHDRLMQEESETAQQRQDRMFRLKQDIKSQVNGYHNRTDEERQLDMAQAQLENEKALKSLDEEKEMREKKKEAQKLDDKQQQSAWMAEKQRRADEKRNADLEKAAEREKLLQETYITPSDRADMRKALTEKVMETSPVGYKDLTRSEKLSQRKDRLQQERLDLADVMDETKRADENEKQKQDTMKRLRRENVDFLKNQMMQKLDTKAREADLEQSSFIQSKDLLQRQEDAERTKQAKKNEARNRYKHDLIEQIEHRKICSSEQNKAVDDVLTPLEIALNKELLGGMVPKS